MKGDFFNFSRELVKLIGHAAFLVVLVLAVVCR